VGTLSVIARWVGLRLANGLSGLNYSGRVACSNCVSQSSACSRDSPHISAEGCNPAQNMGRCGRPNTLQRNSSSSCTHATPAGLPSVMPGSGEVMEGAMQQAAQWGRQIMTRDYIRAAGRYGPDSTKQPPFEKGVGGFERGCCATTLNSPCA